MRCNTGSRRPMRGLSNTDLYASGTFPKRMRSRRLCRVFDNETAARETKAVRMCECDEASFKRLKISGLGDLVQVVKSHSLLQHERWP